MVKELSVIGKGLPLKDGYEKVSGNLKFAGDISLNDMLHAKVLGSPYPHARIVEIDVSKAESLPGVKAIITHKDVPQEEWINSNFNYKRRVMDEKVRCVGDEVAAVAAVNMNVAEEALNLIEVEYEVLPAVFDIEEAMKPNAPKVHMWGNVRPTAIPVAMNPDLAKAHAEGELKPCRVKEWGDIEKGFNEADVIVEHRTTMGCQQQATLDRNACIASWEGDKLTIWTGTQTASELREVIAGLLKMPQNKVRVIAAPVGGSFGLWWINNFHFIPVFLAKKAGKPVKLELTREEVFSVVKRREIPRTWTKLGVKKDGTFTAMHVRHLFDNGAHGFKPDAYELVCDLWGARIPSRLEYYPISTNTCTGGCMRGTGDLTMNFCTEQAIDKAAEKLGMDPLEIRLKNHIRTGDPVRTFNAMYEELGLPVPNLFLSSCGLSECIKKGAEVIGWKEKWKGWAQPVEANGPKRRGLGMAVANHECGLSFLGAPCVTVMINRDGTAQLLTNAGRMGQGLETTQTQIAAEELGLRFESINGKYDDTDACPWGICTYASVGAHQVGRVTQAAAADAKRQLCEFASKQLGAKPEELDIKDGIIHIKHQPEKGIRICDLFSPEFFSAPTIVGTAALNLDKSLFAQPLMAHFVEVEVDIETGRIKILKYVAVHDSGKIINPEVTENQVHGGVFQGCGLALVEDLVFDERSGAVLNPNYVDYKILRALDMPDPEVIFEEVIDPVGPFGVKGLGEAPANPTVAAVAQAIHNAIGVRFNRVPITGEMVLKALRGGATEYGYDSSKGVG